MNILPACLKVTPSLLALLSLGACSPTWDASMRLGGGQVARDGMVVRMHSTRGGRFEQAFTGGCLDLSIGESPKLPNRITIVIEDRSGAVLGQGSTHDLNARRFTIPLKGGGEMVVTPNVRCGSGAA